MIDGQRQTALSWSHTCKAEDLNSHEKGIPKLL